VRSSDLSQTELNAILEQLRSLARTSTPPASTLPTNGYDVPSAFSSPPPGSSQPPTVPTAPISAELRAFLNTIAPPAQPAQSAQPVTGIPPVPPILSSVLSSLVKNGMPTLSTDALGNLKRLQSVQNDQVEVSALQAYERTILNIRIKPTSAELSRWVSRSKLFLVTHF
jgi:hypothetical protein